MEKIAPTKEWSAALRWNHWLMALVIVALIPTGVYIAAPFTVYPGDTVNKMFMGEVRFWHILCGVLLGFLSIWRLYLAFFSRFHADWRDFSACLNPKDAFRQACYYAYLSRKAPGNHQLYGPLQAGAYVTLFLMILLILLTGLILMGAGYDAGLTAFVYMLLKPLENWLGGLSTVRWLHHILMWGFILFIVIHVYMAVWYDITFKEGRISSMVSGIMFRQSPD
ncbi:MAG: Ni/Fe-hydrogenase, b-type cytochrome subunit [Deltaproteobacteria bacterium]|nr:Ni/Fe-hydrogenase, b-type cytochrome subunit [Deltaproteobacteria bacterium]